MSAFSPGSLTFGVRIAVNGHPAVGRLLAARLAAIQGIRRQAEEILHGKRHSGGDVPLELAQRNHHVGLRVGVIQISAENMPPPFGTLRCA